MKLKKRILSFFIATTTLIMSTITLSSSASTSIYGDANNDGYIDMSDVVYIKQYLGGKFPSPSHLAQLDYDQSHVVSYMDAHKVQMSLLGYSTNNNDFEFECRDDYTGDDYNIYDIQNGDYLDTYTLGSSLPSGSKSSNYTEESNDNGNIFKENDDFRDRGIIGIDEREVDWSNYGTVKLIYNNTFKGTGFVVAPHVIATAAHCVMNYTTKTNNKCIPISDIYLFENSSSASGQEPYLEASPVYAHIPCNFIDNISSTSDTNNYDYALITVEEDLSDFMMFELGVGLNSAATNTKAVKVSGFPGEYNSGYNHYMYCGSGTLTTNVNSNYIFSHNVDTTPGNSGSPVFITESYINNANNNYSIINKKVVIAIHVASTKNYNTTPPTTLYNRSIRITDELLHFYKNNNRISWS